MTQPEGGYWRSVAMVFSGTAVAQAIPLIGSLLIARLFIPEQFGTFTAWLGVAAIIGVFSTARLEMALTLEPDGRQRRDLAAAVVLCASGVIAALGLIYLAVRSVAGEVGPPLSIPMQIMLFPGALILALAQIWQAWAASEGQFKLLATMRVVQAATLTGLQIGAGIIAPSAEALAAAHLLGVLVGVAVGMWWLPLGRVAAGLIPTTIRLVRRYHRFPLFALPADTVSITAVQLPLVIVASRFGADIAGYLALSFRTLGAPISLLGTAVLDVFKRRAATSWRQTGNAAGIYRQTFTVLAVGSAAATVVFLVLGEQLFVVAFGEPWREAGRIAVWLLPLFALRFVASPLSYIFYIAERQDLDLIWQISLLVVTVATLLTLRDYATSLQVYALAYGCLYLVYIAMSYKLSLGTKD